jgi:hypothetical protein
MVESGVSYLSQYGVAPAASFEFRQNGTLTYWVNGFSYTGTWYIEGVWSKFQSDINVPAISMSGYISELGGENMVLNINYGYRSITLYLIKL